MTQQMTFRSFSELQKIRSFDERYEYLRLPSVVGEITFGFDRYLNQQLYTSRRWLRLRDEIIVRDKGCDLGVEGYEIGGRIIIHHMNPVSIEDIEFGRSSVFDPEVLICTSHDTHQAIHYGDNSLLPQLPIERRPGDTVPWRRNKR